jgi:hypothetical protein
VIPNPNLEILNTFQQFFMLPSYMKKILFLAAIALTLDASAQLKLPELSPESKIIQSVWLKQELAFYNL